YKKLISLQQQILSNCCVRLISSPWTTAIEFAIVFIQNYEDHVWSFAADAALSCMALSS
ncbi:hypothetical protein ATANTOWER_024679, partial [Ataeniobius toweri]|nr:hypothetical protein [Ataeniobius toweri]